MNKQARINDINVRMAAIEAEMRTAPDQAALDKLTAEARSLGEEKTRLFNEIREEAANAFRSGSPVATPAPAVAETSAQDLNGLSKREKLYLAVGRQVRNHPFTDVEKRALGTALTTTASVFVTAAEGVDGVNNAGVFIQTKLILDLLREDGKLSPILEDINFTNVPGLLDFVYRKSRDKAKVKAEGAEGKDNQMEWATITLVKGYLQTIIRVTDEVKALTDVAFGEYLVSQILQDLNEDWVEKLLYGTGQNEEIKGVTIGATAAVAGGYLAGAVIAAIVAGIKLCKGKYRRGAKIYMAQDVYDEIFFAIDDNGNFKYPVLNNNTGISSFGLLPVRVDENLKEGDFLIGNVNKWFKANSLIPIRLETQRYARSGITEYVASEFCATAPIAGAFIYGSKKA